MRRRHVEVAVENEIQDETEIENVTEAENGTEAGNVIGVENVRKVGGLEVDLRRGRRIHPLRRRNVQEVEAEAQSDIDIETKSRHCE